MTLYSLNGDYPTALPFRIKLSNGMTRTDPTTFTPEEIADAGYAAVPHSPTPAHDQTVHWSNTESQWILRDKTESALQAEINAQWNQVRLQRDRMIADMAWRYERHQRHTRLNLPPMDDIVALDTYVQALADLPQTQTDPYNITWPTYQTHPDHTDPK